MINLDTNLLEQHVLKLVEENNLAVEKLTKEQLTKVISQMIACGDIVRYVTQDNSAQAIVYIPFKRVEELEARVRELESMIRDFDYDAAIAKQKL